MDEFIAKFTSLLWYLPEIHKEKVKVQQFVNSLPLFMKECLEFDNSKMKDEVIWKAQICYQKNKKKGDVGKRWADKKGIKFTSNHKGNKGTINKGPYKGQNNWNMNRNQPIFKLLCETKMNEQSGRTEVELTTKSLVQCWGCGGPHYVKNCPHRKGADHISQIQEASTVGKVAGSIPKISASLEDHLGEYQPTMVEFEGKFFDRTISILIDPRATLMFESC